MSLSDRMLILCGGKCSGEVTDVAAAPEEEIGLLMGGRFPTFSPAAAAAVIN